MILVHSKSSIILGSTHRVDFIAAVLDLKITQISTPDTSCVMIRFETAVSVWELIWEVALAYFIIRISFVYCTLKFICSGISAFFFNSSGINPHAHLLCASRNGGVYRTVQPLGSVRWRICHYRAGSSNVNICLDASDLDAG